MKASASACQTCKTRRVKCDGNKPSCQRCTKADRICIPASTERQISFHIHNENQFASGRSKRPRGPRSSFVAQVPEPDLDTKALAYYTQYHLQLIPNGPFVTGGLSECVAAWRSSGRTDSMVDLAISAMALAVFGNTHNDLSALHNASAKYYRLLQVAQQRIAKVELPSLDGQDMDACLLTIFLMGRYEGATYRPGEQNPRECFKLLQSWSHHEGVMAILQVWYEKSGNKPASEIVMHSRRGQLRSAILRSRILPDWLEDGARFGERGKELEYDRIIIRTILLRQSLACAQLKANVSIARITELLHEMRDIETVLEDWFRPLSKTCPRYQLGHPNPTELPSEHIYGKIISSYQQLGHAGTWTQYFGARLLAIGTHLRILELGSPDLVTYCTYRHERLLYLDYLTATADDLAASVPFGFEQVRPIDAQSAVVPDTAFITKDTKVKPYITGLLVWPMTLASSMEEVDATQRGWFKSELASIGNIMGDGMLKSVGTGEWDIKI